MSFETMASHAGTTSNSIQQLLSGHATEGIGTSLGTSSSAVQKFLNGQASDGVASAIGISSSELQHLRNVLDAKAAIGFILGIAVALPKSTGGGPD
jgi:hypothetical protein